MKNVLTLAGREVRSSFVTPLAYVIIAGFLLLSGFFFFTLLQQFNTVLSQSALTAGAPPSLNEWVVAPFYQTIEVVLIFLIPILTMRGIAEERKTGTFELLATSPISSGEIVLGKFIGLSVVVVVMLTLSFSYPLVLIAFTDAEILPIVIGFLGIVLFSVSFVALSLAISACTKSETVAGVISLVVLLVFYAIDAPAAKLGGSVADVLHYLAPATHAETFVKGVLTGSDLVYFLSVTLTGVFMANRILDAQNWR